MRVALISDLHANEVALDAVLADIQWRGADRIVCLGDVATLGPAPHEVLARLRDLGCACILGNHDEFVFNPGLLATYTEAPPVVAAVDWCRAELTSDEVEFVRGFVPALELELAPGATLSLFHGTPRSHMENLLATTTPEALDEMLDGRSGTVMAGGHTHIQMLRQHRGVLLVNPGSVGLPFREFVNGRAPTLMAHAEYAIVEGAPKTGVSVSLQRVELDRKALRDAAASSSLPLRGMLVASYS